MENIRDEWKKSVWALSHFDAFSRLIDENGSKRAVLTD